jgi:hypothetical protein
VESIESCPQCGAVWRGGQNCRDFFDQMGFWEVEYPENQVVHHLMVLCFHIQHPDRYSRKGLEEGQKLLVDFLEGGLTTEEARRRNRTRLDSGVRTFSIKGTPENHGAYDPPIRWPLTAADVAAAGREEYIRQIERWAHATLDALRASGVLEG